MTPATERLFWLLRHAKTVADPPKGGTDHERRLAPRGRRDADALAVRLGDGGDRLGLTPVDLPEVVLCSTATRTRQTAERALAKLAEPPPVDYLASLYDASIEAVLDEVRRLEDGVGSVMVVGHNPTAHALAFEMMAASDKAGRRQVERVGFPTCSLAVYRLNIRRWSDLGLGSATLIGLFVPPY